MSLAKAMFCFMAFIAVPFPCRADPTQALIGDVTWHAVGTPGIVKIDGSGGKAAGSLTTDASGKVSGEIISNLTDFKTGSDLRDKHMREKYLATDKYPIATLMLKGIEAKGKFKWTGDLTLKGKTKTVSGEASKAEGDNTFTADFDLNLDDFNIGVPSYLGVTVAKTVHVSVAGKLAPK